MFHMWKKGLDKGTKGEYGTKDEQSPRMSRVLMEASMFKLIARGVEAGETNVLKDALGLGVLLFIIASSQMASFVLGA